MRFCGPTARTDLKFRPVRHTATMQWHSLGCKAQWVFSSSSSLVSFYGWRHRNSWLIWMTYPRISAWIYWYKNELNSYLKSTFPPATQRKASDFKMSLFEIKLEKSCQVFNSKVFPAHSLQYLDLNNSTSRVSKSTWSPLHGPPLLLQHRLLSQPSIYCLPSPISAHPYLPLFTWQNCYHHQIWFFSDCLTTKLRENKQLHGRVFFKDITQISKGLQPH